MPGKWQNDAQDMTLSKGPWWMFREARAAANKLALDTIKLPTKNWRASRAR
jgi:hypothetical protein